MGENVSPPYSNTGVQNTYRDSLIALVDWVSITFPGSENWKKVLPILGMDESTFKPMKTGMNGYKKQYKRGHIIILCEGGTADMGVHVIMSGQGCREFESEYKGGWDMFFCEVFVAGGHFARLDLAIDDYKGYYTPKQVVKKLENGLTAARFKDYRYMKKGRIIDGAEKGTTVYLGSDHSDIQIRIYDKLQERQEAGYEVQADVKHWVRTEVQLSDKRANMAAQQIVYEQSTNGTNIGVIIAGILKNYVKFYDRKTGDSNKSRWPIWEPWEKFLGNIAKLKLTIKAPDRTIDSRRSWIDKQTAKTLGMLFLAYNSDLDWLIDTLNKGMELLEDRDFNEIETYQRNKVLIDAEIASMRLAAASQESFGSFDDYLVYRTQLLEKMRAAGEEFEEGLQ